MHITITIVLLALDNEPLKVSILDNVGSVDYNDCTNLMLCSSLLHCQ